MKALMPMSRHLQDAREQPTSAQGSYADSTGSYTISLDDGRPDVTFVDGNHDPLVMAMQRPHGIAPPYGHHEIVQYHIDNHKHHLKEDHQSAFDIAKTILDDDFYMRGTVESLREGLSAPADDFDRVEQPSNEEVFVALKAAEEVSKAEGISLLATLGSRGWGV